MWRRVPPMVASMTCITCMGIGAGSHGLAGAGATRPQRARARSPGTARTVQAFRRRARSAEDGRPRPSSVSGKREGEEAGATGRGSVGAGALDDREEGQGDDHEVEQQGLVLDVV